MVLPMDDGGNDMFGRAGLVVNVVVYTSAQCRVQRLHLVYN